ncbi:unnamed protein product [Closterium sp. NIES-53]
MAVSPGGGVQAEGGILAVRDLYHPSRHLVRLQQAGRIRCATLSSTESEYVAAVEAGKEARRLRFLLAEFQLLRSEEPTTLFVDNTSAISVAGGMGLKGSLKHMERRHMWLQHMVKRRKLQLQYIPTSEQPADYLTKALHFPAFSRCFEAVGQVRLSSEGSET